MPSAVNSSNPNASASAMALRFLASRISTCCCCSLCSRTRMSAPMAVFLRIRRAVTYRQGKFYEGQPKTSAGVRDVAVPPHIRPILKAHLRNHVGRKSDALLFTDDGTHLRGDQYRVHWEKAGKAIGKPNLRLHDLRHVGAVLAAQSGATTAELMHRLGHTTPEMALRYQHVAEGRDAEIAERLSELAKRSNGRSLDN
jgi:integrase